MVSTAQGDNILVTTGIPHYTNEFHRQGYRKGLAGFMVSVGVVKLFDKDGVCFAKDIRELLPDFTENTHPKPGTREW